jgi:hypothetical protein
VFATVSVWLPSTVEAGAVVVFFTDFNSGVPSQFSGVTSTIGVSNCTTVGFGGNFLRNTTTGSTTTLTLTGLSGHTSIDLNFLLAIVSSWDGTSVNIAPDYFDVRVDGNLIFHHAFDHTELSDQSYSEGSNQLIP